MKEALEQIRRIINGLECGHQPYPCNCPWRLIDEIEEIVGRALPIAETKKAEQ